MSKNFTPKTGILFVNLGTPDAPTPRGVRRFLREFLSDKRVVDLPRLLWLPILYGVILPFRSRSSAKNYKKIWAADGSPLSIFSHKLVEKIKARGTEGFSIKLAMRYGKPSIKSVLDEFKSENIVKLVVLPMFPQYSSSTTASVFDEVSSHLKSWKFVPDVRFVNHYADHPAYIEALAESVRKHRADHGSGDKLLFSFHGIPKRFFEQGDPYYCYCHKTARLVAEKLGLSAEEWQLVFQSRFGREEWLTPYCDITLQQLPQDGCKSVDLICPGFSVDCLETLEEIAMENKKLFLEAGGESYNYIPALNADDHHVQLFEQLIKHQ